MPSGPGDLVNPQCQIMNFNGVFTSPMGSTLSEAALAGWLAEGGRWRCVCVCGGGVRLVEMLGELGSIRLARR